MSGWANLRVMKDFELINIIISKAWKIDENSFYDLTINLFDSILMAGDEIWKEVLESTLFEFFEELLTSDKIEDSIKQNILFIVGNFKVTNQTWNYFTSKIFDKCFEICSDSKNNVLSSKAKFVFINIVLWNTEYA